MFLFCSSGHLLELCCRWEMLWEVHVYGKCFGKFAKASVMYNWGEGEEGTNPKLKGAAKEYGKCADRARSHSFYFALLGPTAALREYITSQLNQELAQLRLSVEQRLAATEEQFNTKLAQLEKTSGAGKGSGKSKKK